MVENLQAFEKKSFQVLASKKTVIIIEARKRLEKLLVNAWHFGRKLKW